MSVLKKGNTKSKLYVSHGKKPNCNPPCSNEQIQTLTVQTILDFCNKQINIYDRKIPYNPFDLKRTCDAECRIKVQTYDEIVNYIHNFSNGNAK
jgi:hypothetical protein